MTSIGQEDDIFGTPDRTEHEEPEYSLFIDFPKSIRRSDAMSATGQTAAPRHKYHTDSYRFVFEALHHTQQKLKRPAATDADDDRAHITGPELLYGIRDLALERYGLLSKNVFTHWGIKGTGDFGRIVFELIERGEMRKTDRDQLSDFLDVYDFEDALDRDYKIDISKGAD